MIHPEEEQRLIEAGTGAVRAAKVIGVLCMIVVGIWQGIARGAGAGVVFALLYLVLWRFADWLWHRLCHGANDLLASRELLSPVILLKIHFAGEVVVPLACLGLMAAGVLGYI